MTTTNAAPALPVPSSVPHVIEAKLRVHPLGGTDDPLPMGGTLSTVTSGLEMTEPLNGNGASHEGHPVSGLGAPPAVSFLLETATGVRLLHLELAVTDFGVGPLQDRIEVQVRATGISDAPCLPFVPASYTWRLTGHAVEDEHALKLSFELVQEAEPTEHFDTQASTRLTFTDDGGGAQRAAIKIKRSPVGPVATP